MPAVVLLSISWLLSVLEFANVGVVELAGRAEAEAHSLAPG